MNPAPVFERVYVGLKQLLREGKLRPGERLDPAVLSDRLIASVTPVRDALHRLAGERLVDARSSDGFIVPLLTEPDLHDLYVWNHELLKLAARHAAPTGNLAFVEGAIDAQADEAEQVARLFEALARHSGNREHLLAIAALNDRLHAVRRLEPDILGSDPELSGIASAGLREFRGWLGRYHRRRLQAAAQIVRALYRSPR